MTTTKHYYKLTTSRKVRESFSSNPIYDKDKILLGEAYLTSDNKISLAYNGVSSEDFTLEEITKKEFNSAVSEFERRPSERRSLMGFIG